jgi:ferredoxin
MNDVTKEFEEYAYENGVYKIGYTKIPKEYTTSEMYDNVIVGILEMDESLIESEPDKKEKEKCVILYIQITKLMYKLCKYIESKGYHTYMIDQLDRTINFSIVAQEANLGLIGDSNLLVSENIGPGTKILLITTDMPVPITEFKNNNIKPLLKSFCNNCHNCVNKCPKGALYMENNEVKFDRKKCDGYQKACTDCIANCFFYNDTTNLFNNLDKLNVKSTGK